MNNLKFLLIFLCSLAILNSCKKKRAEVDTETVSSQDNAVAEQSYSKVNTEVVAVSIKEEGINKTAGSSMTCATVTILGDSTYPKTIIIDYGNGCTGADGGTVVGKITAQISAKWNTIGSTISYTLDNYSRNGIIMKGTVQLINNGNYAYTTKVSGGQISGANWTVHYEGEKTVKWIAGMATDSIVSDDIYEISGSSIGVSREGVTFATVILQPLKLAMDCKFITAGQVSVTPSGKPSRNVNYGLGTCDNKAVVTINGSEFEINLQE